MSTPNPNPPRLMMASTRDGECPCTGPECASLRIDFHDGQIEVHHPDPELAREVALAAGKLYAEIFNGVMRQHAAMDELASATADMGLYDGTDAA